MAIVMPFGRYRGMTLDGVPTSYLRWTADKITSPELRAAIDREIAGRLWIDGVADVPDGPIDPAVALSIVQTGVRDLVATAGRDAVHVAKVKAAASWLLACVSRGEAVP